MKSAKIESAEMICKPVEDVLEELEEERVAFDYFKEIDRKQESQTIESVVKNANYILS